MIAGVLVLGQESTTGDIPAPDHVIVTVITIVAEAEVETEIETDTKLVPTFEPLHWQLSSLLTLPTYVIELVSYDLLCLLSCQEAVIVIRG